MTHFLNYVCPEFAEEVIHVFNSFVAGDPSLVAESVSIRAQAHEEELEANEADPELQAEIAKKYEEELVARAKAIEDAGNTIQHLRALNLSAQDDLDKKVVELKANKDEYEAVLKLRAARELDLKTDLEETKAELEADSLRPANVLKGVANPLAADRHSVPLLHQYAHRYPNDIGVALSREAQRLYVDHLFAMGMILDRDNLKTKYTQMITSSNRKTRATARKMLLDLSRHALTSKQRNVINNQIQDFAREAFCAILGRDAAPDLDGIKPHKLRNRVSLQAILYKAIKLGKDVAHCTEIPVEQMRGIGVRFNDHMVRCKLSDRVLVPEEYQADDSDNEDEDEELLD